MIISGEWEVEPEWGLQQLAKYLEQIQLLESGASIEELAFSQMRESQRPRILDAATNQATATGRQALSDVDGTQPGSIAHIRIRGVMQMDGGLSSRGIRTTVEDIRAADNNPNIAGIFLEVDSGGGDSMAGTTLQNALSETSTPVLAYYQMAASAALKGVLPARRIIGAGPDAKVGSIGTMVSINKRAIKFFQENYEDIYATAATNKNKEFRAYLQGDRGPLINTINKTNKFFQDQVKAFRKLNGDQDQVDDTLSGHLFNTEEAIDRGLADGFDTFQGAINQLSTIIQNEQPRTFSASGFFNQNFKEMNLIKFLQSLIPMLNQKLGTEISDAAKPEEVLQELEKAPTLSQVKAEIKTELQEEWTTQQEETAAQIQQLTEQVASLQEQLEEHGSQVETLEAERDALEHQVAKYQGKASDHKEGKINTGQIDVSKLKTSSHFMASITPPGDSKY